MSDDGASIIRAKLTALYGECLTFVSDVRSPWGQQLVEDVGRALGTLRWIEGDVERRRIDDEKKENGE